MGKTPLRLHACSALHNAAEAGDVESIKAILGVDSAEETVGVHLGCVFEAVCQHNVDHLDPNMTYPFCGLVFLQAINALLARKFLGMVDQDDHTPLHLAIIHGKCTAQTKCTAPTSGGHDTPLRQGKL